ncbi:hypothetical protein [Opitutus terrae]|uniref:Uncharacterized protein n=1 Tax=Opitutus terrae (strain DSM 11246 / JCM 15787 / PB90-1) TaxID=452637 RepID=B1ZZ23_OPITP|nr:hypothetical protein [Opitutus terrae]ACB77095.1 hypothetical protein Oter_3820 [Opitutus terrae PB90-1]
MNKKLERELHGPSWTEVILGAVLSLLLGVVLAAVYLVLKPVAAVKELPKEPATDVVYYLEGTRDLTKARQAAAKQKAFVQGGSVVLNEDELNTLLGLTPAVAKSEAEAAAAEKTITPGTPNFRIRDNVLQIGVPVQIKVLGFAQNVIVQARGGFAQRGDRWVFDPTEFYVGSCPLQRLPAVEGMLVKQVMAGATIPEDVAAAWQRLTGVAVEGSALRLTVE